ncbi:hypothetical protein HPP92_014191 [Vanilla planifolia]|uniref:TPX2 central domain-containing protein n=2 Tax=Vanilla planifolia TaxID=51239 RepID=A0A835UVZ8_VANPL|nr:hypothetical protein HPP92_014191 [Vanilla planifolia]
MDEEMGMKCGAEEGRQCSAIDIDYEFDAPRYFELGRAESTPEARQAELWFERAQSYPPSPFIVRINFGKNVSQNRTDALMEPKYMECLNPSTSQMDACINSSLFCEGFKGMHDTFMQHILLKDDKSDTNEEVTPIYPNFMKPTVSQLARQHLLKRSNTFAQSLNQSFEQSGRITEDSMNILLHAAKRQRVDGGIVQKVIGMPQKNDLVHKSTNKKCLANGNYCPSTLRLTIPREPVLETARRAKYFRAQRSKHPEGNVANVTNFRALPLNRKILEAPSLHFPKKSTPQWPEFKEFKLKTLQRAIQRSTSAKTQLSVNNLHPSSTIKGCWTGSKILNDQPSSSTHQTNDVARGSNLEVKHSEKRSNFSQSKMSQQPNPLSELFNKLSISLEVQQSNSTHSNFAQSSQVAIKDTKENVNNPIRLYEG